MNADSQGKKNRSDDMAGTRRWISGLTLMVLCACESPVQTGTHMPQLPPLVLDGLPADVQSQIETAHRGVTKNPDSAQANGYLGMIFHAYANNEPASIAYQRARLLDPNNFRWAYYHGVILKDLGEIANAIDAFRQAIGIDPGHSRANQRLAELLREAGELGQSRGIFVKLIESHPEMSQAHYGLGSVLARQGDSRLAVQSFERAIELSPRYAPAHYGLALIYRQQDNPEAAEHHFSLHEKYKQDRSYAYDPMLAEVGLLNQSDQLPMQHGRQFVAQGRVEAAIEQFVLATERNPNNAAAHTTLVGLYGYLGKMEPAQTHYYLAVSLDPSQAKLHFNWGAALAKSGRYIEAAEVFVRTLEIDPQDANAHWQLGFSLENQGNNAAALAQYRLAVDDNPKHKEAHYLLGRQLAHLGEYTQAVMHIEQSLAPAHQRTPLFLRGLAETYAEMGNTQLAAETLERAKRSAEKWNTPPLSQSQ